MTHAECLVLDMDDTLFPERQYVLPRIAAVARHMEARFGPVIDFEKEMTAHYLGRNDSGRMFDDVLAQAGLPADANLIRELVALYRDGSPALELYPDVRPALEMWGRRLPLALVTDGHAPTQRKKVAALGLATYVREIIYTDELGPGRAKPSTAAFLEAQRRIGFSGPAVMVGDNPSLDIPGPRELGWVAVRIIRPGARFADVAAEGPLRPDHVIRSLADLDSIPELGEI